MKEERNVYYVYSFGKWSEVWVNRTELVCLIQTRFCFMGSV